MSFSDSMAIISLSSRYGAFSYANIIEYVYFPPSNPELAAKYQIQRSTWKGCPWHVITVPAGFSETAEKVAEQWGMKLVRGRPKAFTAWGVSEELFPLPQKFAKVFTLENRERPAIHSVPYESEMEQAAQIIKEAGKMHNADFSEILKLSKLMQSLLNKESSDFQSQMVWKRFGIHSNPDQ